MVLICLIREFGGYCSLIICGRLESCSITINVENLGNRRRSIGTTGGTKISSLIKQVLKSCPRTRNSFGVSQNHRRTPFTFIIEFQKAWVVNLLPILQTAGHNMKSFSIPYSCREGSRTNIIQDLGSPEWDKECYQQQSKVAEHELHKTPSLLFDNTSTQLPDRYFSYTVGATICSVRDPVI